eukprot:scaffold294917_cov9-Tisochrysis_lutea.AAC.1
MEGMVVMLQKHRYFERGSQGAGPAAVAAAASAVLEVRRQRGLGSREGMPSGLLLLLLLLSLG